MEKVLATGLSGTIGSRLPKNVTPINLDLGGEFNLDQELMEAKTVIHLAGVVGNTNVLNDRDYAFKVNVTGTINLAKQVANCNETKFVYISSSHVYKKSSGKLDENSAIEPISVYAEQKAKGEQGVFEIFKSCPQRLVIVRVFSLLDWTLPNFTLGGMARQIYLKQSKSKIKFCDDERDFLSSLDVAHGIYKISMDQSAHGVINLCTGRATSVGTAIGAMFSHTNFKGIQDLLEAGTSETPTIMGDDTKLRNLLPDLQLEWNPKYGVESLPHP